MDGQMGGWTDGQIDGYVEISVFASGPAVGKPLVAL